MNTKLLVLFVLIAASAGFGQKVVQPKLFGVNLVKNGGAEAGNGSPWTNGAELKTFAYDGGWGDAWQVTPPDHGKNFFYARVANDLPETSFSQTIDVSSIAKNIDEGKVSYALGGWFGRRGDAAGRLIVSFLAASGNDLGKADSTEEITRDNSPDDVTMVEKSRNGAVPAQTRRIKVTLKVALFYGRDSNDGDNGLADNLSLVLSSRSTDKQ